MASYFLASPTESRLSVLSDDQLLAVHQRCLDLLQAKCCQA